MGLDLSQRIFQQIPVPTLTRTNPLLVPGASCVILSPKLLWRTQKEAEVSGAGPDLGPNLCLPARAYKWRPREVMFLTQGHTARRKRSQVS